MIPLGDPWAYCAPQSPKEKQPPARTCPERSRISRSALFPGNTKDGRTEAPASTPTGQPAQCCVPAFFISLEFPLFKIRPKNCLLELLAIWKQNMSIERKTKLPLMLPSRDNHCKHLAVHAFRACVCVLIHTVCIKCLFRSLYKLPRSFQ